MPPDARWSASTTSVPATGAGSTRRAPRCVGTSSSSTPEELTELCRDADVVFHLAAEKHNSAKATPQKIIDVNISATQPALRSRGREAASPEGGVHVVAVRVRLDGPGRVMRETDVPAPKTVYGISKLAGEHLLRVAHARARAPVVGRRACSSSTARASTRRAVTSR